MTAETVPFGKYKGRPVEDMLADAEYMTWLEAQPWFRQRYGKILAMRDAEAASRTPVHNRLQALFLDPAYGMAFSEVVAASWWRRAEQEAASRMAANAASLRRGAEEADQIAARNEADAMFSHWAPSYREKAAAARGYAARIEGARPEREVRATFEHAGADVRLSCILTWLEGYIELRRAGTGHGLSRLNDVLELAVEIKPVVADDYPAVLRQMNRNRSAYLFVDRYEGEGATEAQFVAIFKASGKTVVFKRDVDAELARMREGEAP